VTALRRILQALGTGAAGLLIAAFVVGYAAPHLSPVHFWWTNLFAVFLPPLGLAVGVLAVGLGAWGLYRRSWGRVALAGGLLVLLAVRFGPRLTAWGRPAPPPGGLRVMTFNVPAQFVGRPRSAVPMAAFVEQEAPDILAVQESQVRTGDAASLPDAVRLSASLHPLLRTSTGYALPRHLPANTRIQQPVMGRVRLDSMTVHPLPPSGRTDARSRYTRTTFAWRGRTAVLYNVHLHTIGAVRPWERPGWPSLAEGRTFLRSYRQATRRRAQQARLLRRRIEREPHPVLVAGDFNSTPHQWAYRHVAQGLQSAATQRVTGWTATFPARRPLVRIDHVLAGPAWRVADAHVPEPTTPAISDHRAVVARLQWRR
jgi:endonuclease/exonuclease/phosphatase family metal-dependent hydrolase